MGAVNDFEGFRGDERRGRELNYFEGFGEHERGRQLNWFRGFGEGMVEETNEVMNERRPVNAAANVGAQGDMNEVNEGMHAGMNAENARAREGEGARGRARGARGRAFRGRRSVCRLCGASVSYANMARHERTHRQWDPGGGPHPV